MFAFAEAIIGGGAVVGAALITGPLLWTLNRNDKRNTLQHQAAQDARQRTADELAQMKMLLEVSSVTTQGTREAVDRVEGHVMAHITDHALHTT